MVMLISKFHRLIQSRLLWGTFLVIIVFTFVIWGTQMPDESEQGKGANAAGKLHGEYISREQFRDAYYNTYMAAVLAVGRPFDINAAIDQQIRASAWRRLAAMQEAGKLGIATSDEEVSATIQNHPGFGSDGRFNQGAYSAFLQNVLAPMGFTPVQFEEHVRQEITLQKLQQVIQQSILISPYEVTRTFRSLTDTFDVEYVVITTNAVAGDVKVTAQDARAFYLADPAAFTLSEKVRVQYVAFPATNYLAQSIVTNEEDALAYYDEFIDTFMVTNLVTNTLTQMADNGELQEVDVVTNRAAAESFDLVKTNILEILSAQAARDKAADFATEFVVTLAPDRDGNAPSFDDAAKSNALTVHEPEAFELRSALPEVDAGLRFNLSAFNLEPNPEQYFSDPIVGSNYVYVIGLVEKFPARVPEYEEVEDLVKKAAYVSALGEAMSKKAQDVREAAIDAVEAGSKFKDAVKPFGLVPVDTGSFTLAGGGLETNEYTDMLMRGILPRNEGEVSDPLPTDDAILIAFVAQRKPGDATEYQSFQPQIRNSVRQQRSRILFEAWQDSLLKKGEFVDLSAVVVPDEEAPEEDTSPAEEEDSVEW